MRLVGNNMALQLFSYYIKGWQKGLTIIALLTGIQLANAQPNIVKAEYYINTDPGVGAGIDIPITPGPTINLNFSAVQAVDTLSSGYHTIYIRTKDANGTWSFGERRTFYVLNPVSIVIPPIPNIITLEYFIDDDPGPGLATTLDVTDMLSVDINSLIDLSAPVLASGYHIIGFRSRNANGTWGWSEYRIFYVTTTGNITVTTKQVVAAEYFFDTDPGQGNATPLGSFAAGFNIDLNELVPNTLTTGYHTFNVRSKDEDGHWGFVERRPVYVTTAGTVSSVTDISKVEYFFDGNDPGFGSAIDLPITSGQVIEFNTIDIPTSPTLIDGQHTLHFRARNGNGWGLTEIDTFDVLDDCIQPIAGFTPQLACAGQPVTFLDTSTSLQPDATYRWYLDGDDLVDDTTTGSTSFSYPFPGTYVVALAIRQGTICLDSISTTIDIQPLPVAVFSSSGSMVNQPTSFVASASNLPPGAVWEWDFDSDLIVDDNTAGNTSFTYTSTGTFNPTLTITDQLGCGVTATNPVIITNSGNGGTPSVDFLAGSGCAGTSINFIDISQNLPANATYSWDFDGDGTTDDTTVGSVIYTFLSASTYDASLTIDLGGSTISSSHTIEIVDVPIADFSAVEVCEGTAMAFTDLSTPGLGAGVYMWDFDNDGVVDSNASTNVSFTYTTPGSHIVSLSISNGFGCEHEVVKQVTVVQKPTPNFDWNLACTGETVSFNDLSQDVLNGASYSWDLDGDGLEDAATVGNASFNYPSGGSYVATLTIDNLSGCTSTISKQVDIADRPEVIFQVNAQCYGQESQMIDLSQNVGAGATYRWDFQSDGIIDDTTVGNTGFTYDSYNSYIVTLVIDNGGGCQASAEELVEFADAATPDFTTNKLCEGEEVIFTNLSTAVNPAAIYSWDFDGDSLEDSAFPGSTAFTFEKAGTYDATLIIDNGGNCLAYKTYTLDITPPPLVDLGSDLNLCVAGTVTFDAGTGYSAYLWPDGSSNQTYTVNQIGDYAVRVQDAKQCFNSDTISVNLLGPPVPKFTHSFDLSYQGIRVIFQNLSTNATSYTWDFGEGTTSDEENPSIIFGDYSFYQTSVYTVCLTATNECDEAMFCEEIFVSPTEFLEEADNKIRVYPVPTRQYVNLKLRPGHHYRKAALLNPVGEVLWLTENPQSHQEIDLREYSSGIYYVIIETDDRYYYKKILKR